jgi:N utilization substance protein B
MISDEQPEEERKALERSGRHAARIAAVQATYQIDATGMPASRVLAEFVAHRFSAPEARSTYGGADKEFFAELLRGASDQRARLDGIIEDSLAQGWSSDRIDRVLYAILRCGAFEVVCREDIPPKVAINEYVEVARAFFEGDEPGFVNGVLDSIARKTRAAEMGKKSGASAAGTG